MMHKPFTKTTKNKVVAISTATLLSMSLMGTATFAAEGDNVPIDDSLEELKTDSSKEKEKPTATDSGTVTVHHIDPSGKELRPATKQTGKIGAAYVAENQPIDGYEIVGYTSESDGLTEGVFTKDGITVTYVYDTFENVSSGKTELPDGLVAIPADFNDVTPTSPPSGGDAQTAAVGDDVPINDDLEELKPGADAPSDAPQANPDAGTGAIPVPTAEEPPRLTPITPVDPNANPDAPSANAGDSTVDVPAKTPVEGVPGADTAGEVDENGDGTVSDRELKSIPQASSVTNWGMIGAGIAALLAAGASFITRRKHAPTE